MGIRLTEARDESIANVPEGSGNELGTPSSYGLADLPTLWEIHCVGVASFRPDGAVSDETSDVAWRRVSPPLQRHLNGAFAECAQVNGDARIGGPGKHTPDRPYRHTPADAYDSHALGESNIEVEG